MRPRPPIELVLGELSNLSKSRHFCTAHCRENTHLAFVTFTKKYHYILEEHCGLKLPSVKVLMSRPHQKDRGLTCLSWPCWQLLNSDVSGSARERRSVKIGGCAAANPWPKTKLDLSFLVLALGCLHKAHNFEYMCAIDTMLILRGKHAPPGADTDPIRGITPLEQDHDVKGR